MSFQNSITLPLSQQRLASLDTPEFPHLLMSNAPPNPQNASILQQELNAAFKDLEAIDVELPQLEATLKAIHARRLLLTDYVKRYQPVISPVRRLPPEILSQIFLLSRPDGVINMLDATKYPWTLTQVCRGWRTTAISTPRLWSVITPEPIPKNASRAKKIVGTFIDRSKNTPLSVRITSACTEKSFSGSLDRIVSTSPRWAEFTLSIDFSSMLPAFLRQLRGSLHLLHQLTIEGQSSTALYGAESARDIFWTAPKLNRVTIRKVPLTHFQIPWNQITHLDFRYSNPTENWSLLEEGPETHLFDVLRSAPQLEELIYDSDDVEVEDRELVILPSLRSLHVVNASTLTDYITAPSLQSLQVTCNDNIDSPLRISVLSGMISRSRAPLKTLTMRIHPEGMVCNDLLTLFKHTSTLAHLDVDHINEFDEGFFEALTITPTTLPPLLPALKTIKISCACHCSATVIDKLLDFLESRYGDSKFASLTAAHLTVSPNVLALPSRASRLKRLTDDGLDVLTNAPFQCELCEFF